MTVVVELPQSLRPELKEPFGPIFTDVDTLLVDAETPVIAVGDVVTYHLVEAGRPPAVALVDNRTKRSAVDEEVAQTIESFEGFDRVEGVSNPAATLTEDLLSALRQAIDVAATESTLLEVDGEEDLAVLPAVLLAPQGATIVYGQPGEGMVRVAVDDDLNTRVRELLARMDGNTDQLWTLLGIDP